MHLIVQIILNPYLYQKFLKNIFIQGGVIITPYPLMKLPATASTDGLIFA